MQATITPGKKPKQASRNLTQEIDEAAERVTNFLHAMTLEIQMLARACGKADVHDLDPEDLRALTLESSMITGLPLVGTRRVFGGGPGWKEDTTNAHTR